MPRPMQELDALLEAHAAESFRPMEAILVSGLGTIVFTERGHKLVLVPYRDRRYVPIAPDGTPGPDAEKEPTLSGIALLRDFLARGDSYRTCSDRSILAAALKVAREANLEPRIARRFADRLVRDAILPRKGIRIRDYGQLPVFDSSPAMLKVFAEENRGSGADPVEAAIRQTHRGSRTPSLI
jgi:hypothetical protein